MAVKIAFDKICTRWKVSVERYGWSTEDLGRELGATSSGGTRIPAVGRALAVYGETGVVGRVLLFVVSPNVVRPCYQEVLESCVEEICRSVAEEFRNDMRDFEKIVTFDLMNERLINEHLMIELNGPTKRYG